LFLKENVVHAVYQITIVTICSKEDTDAVQIAVLGTSLWTPANVVHTAKRLEGAKLFVVQLQTVKRDSGCITKVHVALHVPSAKIALNLVARFKENLFVQKDITKEEIVLKKFPMMRENQRLLSFESVRMELVALDILNKNSKFIFPEEAM